MATLSNTPITIISNKPKIMTIYQINIKNRLRVMLLPFTVRLYPLTFILLPFAFVLSAFTSKAQTFVNMPMTGTPIAGDYYNNIKLTATPVFSFTPTAGQHLKLYVTGNDCVPLSTIPSADKTYILTTVPRIAGIKDISGFAGRNACDLMQTVQYFDGLGRPIQTVQVMGSPTNHDLVQPTAYDPIGREQYKYLPYAITSGVSDGSYKANALTPLAGVFNFYNPSTGGTGPQQSNGIVRTASPQAQTGFEASPLERVTEQGSPGNSWQLSISGVTGSGHTARMGYGTNATNEVILWTVNTTGTGATGTSYYGIGQLFKNTSTDENGNNTITYKDKSDRLICKKVQSATSTYLATYYIFDDIGNLRYVIPPLPTFSGSNPAVTMPTSFTETDSVFLNYFYGYHYDSRIRAIEKKVPGKDWERIVYNVLDQPILTQDANQLSKGIWMVNKYDGLGRVVMTGEYTSAATRTTLQAAANGITNLWETFTNAATNYGYTHVSYPDITTSGKVLTITYYDNYNVISNTAVNPSATIFTAPSAAVDTLNKIPTGLPVATLVNVLGTTDYLFTVNHYDTFGRVVKAINQSYVGGSPAYNKYDTEESQYSFQSLPVKTTRKHYLPASASPQLTINSWNTYDHTNRVLLGKQQFISQTDTGQIVNLSKVDYNELGQPLTKHLHSLAQGNPAGNTFLQHINYRYNERGWLSMINDPTNLNDASYPGVIDVFAEQLDYDQNNNGYSGVVQNYNGNISSLSWQTKVPASLTLAQERKGYIFTYDPMNELKNAASEAATSGANIYNEALSYDELGNILSLVRKNSSGTTPLNSLTYNYTATGVRGNKLLSVTDNGTVSEPQTSTYTYNTNGSLITDTKKTITTPIVYNELDLPSLVTISTPAKTLTYKYDATGKKLERITKTGATVTEDRVYDDGIEYAGTAATDLDFVNTTEGRAIPSLGAYNFQYHVADHLGNIRAMFADANNNGVLSTDEILQTSDYYPFGREISYSQNLVTGKENKYKYNGKEFQADLIEYDYGARFYDAVIGRWNVVDPMAEINTKWTPYNYVKNSPLNRIDPDGMIDMNDFQNMDKSSEAAHQKKMDDNDQKKINALLAPYIQSAISSVLPISQTSSNTTTCCEGGPKPHEGNRANQGGRNWATATLGFIATDIAIPEPTDAAWPKWAGYAVVGTAAAVYIAYNSDSNNDFYYVTYTKTSADGMVYVGRSSGYGNPYSVVKERDADHHIQGYGPAILSTAARARIAGGYQTRGLDPAYWYTRGAEQTQIKYYRALGISGNSIWGISPKNTFLQQYMNTFTEFMHF
jgi:RHS repeat-associated protein